MKDGPIQDCSQQTVLVACTIMLSYNIFGRLWVWICYLSEFTSETGPEVCSVVWCGGVWVCVCLWVCACCGLSLGSKSTMAAVSHHLPPYVRLCCQVRCRKTFVPSPASILHLSVSETGDLHIMSCFYVHPGKLNISAQDCETSALTHGATFLAQDVLSHN